MDVGQDLKKNVFRTQTMRFSTSSEIVAVISFVSFFNCFTDNKFNKPQTSLNEPTGISTVDHSAHASCHFLPVPKVMKHGFAGQTPLHVHCRRPLAPHSCFMEQPSLLDRKCYLTRPVVAITAQHGTAALCEARPGTTRPGTD